mmetsp:Transcript_31932/g.36221  ORF Transcript_31932/g.36221 Transcript_31932/m.36221 type:complete len:652 (-) Transcript_31932:267-2222(-)
MVTFGSTSTSTTKVAMCLLTTILIIISSTTTILFPALFTRNVDHVEAFVLTPNYIRTNSQQHQKKYFVTEDDKQENKNIDSNEKKKKHVVIIGAGWGGLSAAHALSSQIDISLDITVVDSSPKVGGLVRDGYQTMNGKISNKVAEAGQHGFWDNYSNIFSLLENDFPNDLIDIDEILTGYAEQGQYSPNGLEAVWPVYRQQSPQLPTGIAQSLYTKFMNLPLRDRASAALLVVAFSDFDDTQEAWEKYDQISFRDLCIKLGVTRRCYDEAFEPMILTGLFAPGSECSAAAALGMAYFFVLKSQNSFDVRWCKGNIGQKIFQPWVQQMENNDSNNGNSNNDCDDDGDHQRPTRQSVKFMTSTRVIGFEKDQNDGIITKVICKTKNNQNEEDDDDKADNNVVSIECDTVVFAVGGAALNAFVRNSPLLATHGEFRRFANLRGTGVLATRIYLDKFIDIPYSANACWGFDKGVGMTFFDITKLHGTTSDIDNNNNGGGSVIEVDYYHAASLLVMSDQMIVTKVKDDLNTILSTQECNNATVVDAAIVRLPQAVNWYSPGSYANMPDVQSKSIPNVYFAGDLVRTRHGSWSQEKSFVTGIEAANLILGRNLDHGIIPLEADELHVSFGRTGISSFKKILGFGDPSKAPSLVDFLW